MYRKFAAWPRLPFGARGSRPRNSRQYAATIVGRRATMPVASSDTRESVPAATRSASMTSTRRCAQSRSRARVAAGRSRARELATKPVELRCGWKIAAPQQPRGLLERRVFGKLLDRVSGDDELTALTVDVAQPGGRRDDPFQAFVTGTVDVLGCSGRSRE